MSLKNITAVPSTRLKITLNLELSLSIRKNTHIFGLLISIIGGTLTDRELKARSK